ncbi:uncharacterized protein BJX67DRAFT_366876 [Aspergillus lucknowensis]|uniref:Uncharacterized protein n=1 Tax=Aspergillus lucknowensis TaxID=176173 RepID=A0ABR4LCU5_9EURO
MPTSQMDALGAFSHLADNLPTWITQLSDLTAYTAAKHAEFAEAFRKHSAAPVRPRRRRDSSVCSIHTDSRSQSRVHRKRNSADGDNSSFDSGDGPAVVSTRHNLIIHYDGYTQKSLEELVRNIGTARNNLRKGKMSQLPFARGPRSAATNFSSRSPSLGLAPTSDDQLLASVRSARNRGPPVPQAPRDSLFDLADKHLELAHSFCETAAYHFLRAGRCASELNSVKDRFTVLLKLATSEVEHLQQEKKDQESEEELENAAKSPEPQTLKRAASSEGPIEVDDEQVEVESIDLTAFRASRLRR